MLPSLRINAAISGVGFDGVNNSRHCSLPASSMSDSAFTLTRQPDAAMRCNFRIRLELVIFIVCFVVASAAPIPPSPTLSCRSTESTVFDDVASKAVLADVVFEGLVVAVRRQNVTTFVSSHSSSDAAVLCHVTYRVKRLFKGELPPLSATGDRRQQTEQSTTSSTTPEIASIVLRTRHSGGVGDATTGNGNDDWCDFTESADAPIRLSADQSRTSMILFLSRGEDNVADIAVTGSSWSTSKPPSKRNNRGSSARGSATAVYRFSSPPATSSRNIIKQLTNVGQGKFGKGLYSMDYAGAEPSGL
jgi:hypothetical protein